MLRPTYRFGRFSFDRAGYRLMDADRAIALSPKALDLLGLLVGRPADLVTKDDILRMVWPGIAVTDNAITQAVSDLRQALGDDPARPAYIQTVPRRGYRFIAHVDVLDRPLAAGADLPLPGTAGPPGAKRTIAVCDFVNVTADPDVAWMGVGFAETVTNDLRALRDLRIIDRATLTDAARAASIDAARALGLHLLVVGSYQRAGLQLRIRGRVIDIATGEAVAHARADGLATDVFRLQDAIVANLLAGLRVPVTAAAAARMGVRETSSLEAYRALTEGRLKLETLNPRDVPAAIADFERAIALDARYALAYVGLAHARFWLYEASRWRNRPDAEELRAAVAHARRAIELDRGLAEAHAALALLLASSGRQTEALDAGRTAVALEPNEWRHRFRLGVAAWGAERLACFDEVVSQYPAFAYAYFGTAMVHVARNDRVAAEDVLRQGLAAEQRGASQPHRFPANGLHWLLGLVRLADGAIEEAAAEFDRELTSRGSEMYAAEYAMDAYDGHGFVRLASGDPAGAEARFRKALGIAPNHARSLIGVGVACDRMGSRTRAQEARRLATLAIEELQGSGRTVEAAMSSALSDAADGRFDAAAAALVRLLDEAPPGFAGWTIPIEPLLEPLRDRPSHRMVLDRLTSRLT